MQTWEIALPNYENSHITIGLTLLGRPYLKATNLPWVEESYHSTKRELMLLDDVHKCAYFITIKGKEAVLEVLA